MLFEQGEVFSFGSYKVDTGKDFEANVTKCQFVILNIEMHKNLLAVIGHCIPIHFLRRTTCNT